MQIDQIQILDLMTGPAFLAEQGRITHLNKAAAGILLREGTPLADLLVSGAEEYPQFSGGCMSVTLDLGDQLWSASVTRVDGADIFVLEEPMDDGRLMSLALAARELRAPLSTAIVAGLSMLRGEVDEAPELMRALFRLLRLVGNMTDADDRMVLHQYEMVNVDALYREICEKAEALAGTDTRHITYRGTDADTSLAGNRQQLERALYNLLANAMKFTKEGTIRVELTRSGDLLRLSVTDPGEGIPDTILPTAFRRFQRIPTIEEGRQGMGLGLLQVRTTAADHGGTVLIDRPEGGGTRVTMTLSFSASSPDRVRQSPLFVDYAGGFDHTLIELAECLDSALYNK